MPMLTDAHMGNLEWQAYRVVPSREGVCNLLSSQKAESRSVIGAFALNYEIQRGLWLRRPVLLQKALACLCLTFC